MLKSATRSYVRPLCVLIGGFLAATVARGQITTQELLPTNTVGYLSIRDVASFKAKWEQTKFGQMAQDPLLEAFVKDLQEQIKQRLDDTGVRIGLKFDDLLEVCGGEVCIGTIEPDDAAQKHAVAVIVDVKGKGAEVTKVLAEIDKSMTQRNATKSTVKQGSISMTVYKVPVRRGARMSFNAILFQHEERLFATDHLGVAEHLAGRCAGKAGESLAKDVPAFAVTLDRCAKEARGTEADVVGFFEPLGYSRVSREALQSKKARRADLVKAMEKQGFDAIQGIGGTVTMKNGKHDAELRAFVYAPADPAAGADRYRLAARVLKFGVAGPLEPQAFVPSNVSSYHSALWDIRESYKYVGTLVDEVAGQEGFWKDFLASLRDDPNGPMIDLEKDLIAHLGNRVSVLSDVVDPAAPESERIMVAIELLNAEKMAAAINRMMKNDPATEKHEFDGHIIWEIVPEEEEEDFSVGIVDENFTVFAEGDFADDDEEQDAEEESQPFLASAAISVVKGHLIISSHVDFIMDLIQRKDGAETLGTEGDLQAIEKSLVELGATQNDTLRSFSRLDEVVRVSYELVRLGKMPESEGLFGKALNRYFASEKKGELRKQQINGKNLPEFDKVRKYFNPVGAYLHTDDDGWYVAGAVLADAVSPDGGEAAGGADLETAATDSETDEK